MERDAFEGYDDLVNVDTDPKEALKLVTEPEPAEDVVEPVLDE
jgi:hypothetical protein